ncbi:hypothetical protein [Flavobacterium aquicola]|uniref:Uncharacterized protein n=1 Tax=Flavobacterium aquicola TaxID=1682742 RepID=A0A3E0DWV5_9FLAO|nr:hypothetical protein [Flavobacterium aquicola]REG90451.1 hypothetical protein C8P67_1243 [Flavobacterium aquicola]
MEEPQDIIKSNIENYNKKLAIQDRILAVSIIFIIINYVIVIEPNYSSFKALSFSSYKIQKYSNQINKDKKFISNKIIPDSSIKNLKINDINYNKDVFFQQIDTSSIGQNKIDTLHQKLNAIETAINEKQKLISKNESLKKRLSAAKDEMSLVSVLLLFNDGREHFSLFLSFIITFLIIYFLLIRRTLLNILARTIRIQKEKVNLNEFYEYHVNKSIWLAPIPNKMNCSVTSDELIHIMSLKNRHHLYKIIVFTFLGTIAFLQLRLYFIELSLNHLLLNFYSFLSLLNCLTSIVVIFLWLSKRTIPDNYNYEFDNERSLTRREFVNLVITITPISLAILLIPSIKLLDNSSKSEKIYNRFFNKPRFCKTKGKNSKTKLKEIEFEKSCEEMIVNKDYEKCADKLISEVKAINKSKKNNNNRIIRLSDFLVRVLMFLIYRKDNSKYQTIFNELLSIANDSNNLILKSRKEIWSKSNYKWATVCKQSKSIIKWDNKSFQ